VRAIRPKPEEDQSLRTILITNMAALVGLAAPVYAMDCNPDYSGGYRCAPSLGERGSGYDVRPNWNGGWSTQPNNFGTHSIRPLRPLAPLGEDDDD
jgi:hypothetical protein